MPKKRPHNLSETLRFLKKVYLNSMASIVKNPKLIEIKNIFLVFLLQKYGKFRSVSLDNFIKNKPLVPEE